MTTLKTFFHWLEQRNSLLILSIPFILIIPRALFPGDSFIGDESSFYEPIRVFGANIFSVVDNTRDLRVPQGPLFFIVYGLLGNLVDYSLPALRLINILISLAAAMILSRTLRQVSNFPTLLTFWFVLNPYFLLLTTPYLYTDNLCIFFIISGIYFFVIKEQRVYAGLLWGLAIWTRQIAIFIPLAALLTDLYFNKENVGRQIRFIFYNSIPFFALGILFLLWDYHLTPPLNEYSLKTDTFAFSLRQLNYAVVLTGGLAAPLWLPNFFSLFRTLPLFLAIILLPSILLKFPRRANQDAEHWTMETAGYFDKFLVSIGDFAYGFVPGLWLIFLSYLFAQISRAASSRVCCFALISVLLFWCIEAVYTHAWDKYFLMMIPSLLLLDSTKKKDRQSESHALTRETR